jgi:hypothetical protein
MARPFGKVGEIADHGVVQFAHDLQRRADDEQGRADDKHQIAAFSHAL